MVKTSMVQTRNIPEIGVEENDQEQDPTVSNWCSNAQLVLKYKHKFEIIL